MTCAPPNDLESLAKRYLELWQEQLAALSSQPDAQNWASRMAGLMPQNFANMGAFAKPFTPEAAHASPTPTVATATAAALEHLSLQLAQLSTRIAALEHGLAAKPKPAATKPRKTAKPAARKPARPSARTGKRK